MIHSSSEITALLSGSYDFKTRLLPSKRGDLILFYNEVMCNLELISRSIIEPLVQAEEPVKDMEEVKSLICIGYFINLTTGEEAANEVLRGNAVLYLSHTNEAISCETRLPKGRSIEKSETEVTLLGPRESFNEQITDNLSLIRKRLVTPQLRVERFVLGRKSNVGVALVFLQDTAPGDLVESLRQRLDAYDQDMILSINALTELLAGQRTLLETTGSTELPDVVVSRLVEGRVAVMVQGSPRVLTVPGFFIETLQAPDDYYSNRFQASLLRILRLTALVITVCLPGFYIALSTHHISLIPTTFIFKMAVSRSGVPFPTIVEMLLMQFFFELAREGGRRLPQQVGQSLSVVAALILGEAAVGAGLTSETTVIIVGVYAIASFINPRLSFTSTVWSLAVTAGALLFGLHGFYISIVLVVSHLASIRCFGYPYLFPMGTATTFRYQGSDTLRRSRLRDISHRLFDRGDGN